ncbi:MAG: DUF3540 domain-containing protein, partial [Polyangiales bacterium]
MATKSRTSARRTTTREPQPEARPLKNEVTPLRVVRTSAGASATVEDDAIVVRDPAGAVVVRYDAVTGEARIEAPHGDLTLAAAGKVKLVAGTDVELEAPGTIATTSARMSVHTGEGDVNAERIAVRAAELSTLVGKWELRAQRLVEHVVDAYRDVDGLLQTRAGRMRTLVEG